MNEEDETNISRNEGVKNLHDWIGVDIAKEKDTCVGVQVIGSFDECEIVEAYLFSEPNTYYFLSKSELSVGYKTSNFEEGIKDWLYSVSKKMEAVNREIELERIEKMKRLSIVNEIRKSRNKSARHKRYEVI